MSGKGITRHRTASKDSLNTTVPSQSTKGIFDQIKESYIAQTSPKTKLIDIYLLFTLLSGILVFLYGLLTGAVPYNSFLGGFIATIGSFVLTMNLRIQSELASTEEQKALTQERAAAQFLFCHLFMFFILVNFIG